MYSYTPVRCATAVPPLTSSDPTWNVAVIARTEEKNDSHCDCCCAVMPLYARLTSATSRVPIARPYAATTALIAGAGFSGTGSAAFGGADTDCGGGVTGGATTGGATTGGGAACCSVDAGWESFATVLVCATRCTGVATGGGADVR